MKGKAILVTGANGFIGGWLCRALAENNAVTALVRDKENAKNLTGQGMGTKVTVVEGDITTAEDRETGPADFCVHLAALTDVPECDRDPLKAIRVNVHGTLRVLELCRKAGVKGVAMASSTKVYGNAHGIMDETALPQPHHMYGLTKLAAEFLTREFCQKHGIGWIIPRFANVYGPLDFNSNRVIPNTIARILAGSQPVIFGDGSTQRSFLHVRDAVRFLLLSLDLLERGGEGVFNVGTEERFSVEHSIHAIVREMGWTGGIAYRREILAPPSDPTISVKRAQDMGWSPLISLEEGLRETIRSYMERKQEGLV